MTTNKVYVIEPDFNAGLQDVLQRRQELGRAISALATLTGEKVWFHDFTDQLAGGAPVILLECSGEFLAQAHKLPGFSRSYDLWKDVATQRDPQIQAYYAVRGPGPGGPCMPRP